MTLFRNVVFIAALTGLLASGAMTAMQMFTTVPLILQAEVYENAGAAAGHDHAAAPADQAAGAEAAAAAHEHDAQAWEPSDGIERYAFTLLANLVSGVGFALILVAVSEFAGGIGNWRQGLFWGLAGFSVFVLAPGLGLPPELPAMPAAELFPRQVWWTATALATAAGLALIAFRRSPLLAIAGVALIMAPHIVGAPQPVSFETAIPEGLHHQFVVAVTMTNLVYWVVLGALAGLIRPRFSGSSESLRSSFA